MYNIEIIYITYIYTHTYIYDIYIYVYVYVHVYVYVYAYVYVDMRVQLLEALDELFKPLARLLGPARFLVSKLVAGHLSWRGCRSATQGPVRGGAR